MTLKEAKGKIKNGLKEGFIIHFKKIVPNGTFVRDRIPELGEDLFKTEKEAWKFAEQLAAKSTGEYVDFYLTDGRIKVIGNRTIQNTK